MKYFTPSISKKSFSVSNPTFIPAVKEDTKKFSIYKLDSQISSQLTSPKSLSAILVTSPMFSRSSNPSQLRKKPSELITPFPLIPSPSFTRSPSLFQPFEPKNYIKKCEFKTRSKSNSSSHYQSQSSFIVYPNICKIKGQYLFSVIDGRGINGGRVSKLIKNELPRCFEKRLKEIEIIQPSQFYKTLVKDCVTEVNFSINSLNLSHSPSGSSLLCCFICGDKVICGNIGKGKILIGQKFHSWKCRDVAKGQKSLLNGSQVYYLDLQEFQLTKHDKFIVIASETLWNHMGPDEVVEIISNFWKTQKKGCLDFIIKEFINRSKKISAMIEDISILLLYLNNKSY